MSVLMFVLHAQILSEPFTYHVIRNGWFTARRQLHETRCLPPFKVIFWPYPNPLHTCSSKRTRLKYSLNWWRSCRDYLGLLGHLSGSMGWRKELERSPREFLPGSYGPAGQHITIINCSIHLGLSNWHTKTTNRIYHSR